MKQLITCLLTLVLACSLQGQMLRVSCTRSVDNAAIRPDSIRVMCASLKIDTTITDTVFNLPLIASDAEEPANTVDILTNVELYDVLGRFLTTTTRFASVDCLRWDATCGLVILKMLGQQKTVSVKSNVEVLGGPIFTITAWRTGYVPTTIEIVTRYADQEVALALELLPWWKRVRQVTVNANVPEVTYYTSASGGRGHSSWRTENTDTVAHTFTTMVDIVHTPKDSITKVWVWNDTAISYHRLDVGYGGFPNGPVLDGTITVDTVSGFVKEVSLSRWLVTGGSTYATTGSSVVIRSLSAWDTQTPIKLETRLENDASNNSLVSAAGSFEEYSGGSMMTVRRLEEHGPHFPSASGIVVTCEILLLD